MSPVGVRKVPQFLGTALATAMALCWPLLSACGQEPRAGDVSSEPQLTVGCLYPLTGPMGLFGRDADVAIGMALDRLQKMNQQYRDAGESRLYPRLKVFLEDSKGKRHRSATLARQLVEEQGVQILCGVVYSSIALEISAFAQQEQMLFIGAGHSSSRLTQEPVNPWYFRVNNDSRQSMRAGALYLQEMLAEQPWETLAYVGPDYDYGHQALEDLVEGLRDLDVPFRITGGVLPKTLGAGFFGLY